MTARPIDLDALLDAEFQASATLTRAVADHAGVRATLARVAQHCVRALRDGHKILLAGNGGSAGDAQHMAGELVSRFKFDRPGLPAIALTVDTSILTAIGNDYGYEYVFSRQIQALARPGDVFIAYSTSGQSPNIVQALKVAQSLGVHTVGMTGARRGAMVGLCDDCIEIPSNDTPRIQEGHLMVGHTLCCLIERALFTPAD